MRDVWLSVVFLLISFNLSHSVALAQSDDIETIKLFDIDKRAFPDVSASFQALDEDGNPLRVRSGDIILYEDDEELVDIAVRSGSPTPSNVLFLVDLGGVYSNLSGLEWGDPTVLRESLIQYVESDEFVAGVDHVSLYTTMVAGTGQLNEILSESSSAEAFTEAVNNLNFEVVPNGESYFAMISASEIVNNFDDADDATLAIVYLGDMHTTGQGPGSVTILSGLLDEFVNGSLKDRNIHFYAMHATTDRIFVDHLQLLAELSGGQYVKLSRETGNVSRVSGLYEHLRAYNEAYKVLFRSESRSNDQREVGIRSAESRVEDTIFYSVDVTSPELTFTVPDDVTVEQNLDGSYDDSLVAVSVGIVGWPDGNEREIEQVELRVNGVQADTKSNLPGDVIEFALDLNDYDVTQTLELQVIVEDELGVKAEADRTLVVDVVAAPVVSVTEVAEDAAVSEAPRSVPVSRSQPIERDESMTDQIARWLPVGISLLSLGLIGALFFYFRNQFGQMGSAVAQAAKNVSKTILGGSSSQREKELAMITILSAKDSLVGQDVSIREHVTRFGRDPRLCDIQLFGQDDKSSVSGQHCTLQYDPAQQCFFITDDNSTVGTFINGNLIAPNDPVRLQIGDEIVLGEIARRGAKFQLMSIATDLPETRIDDTETGGLLDTIYEDEMSELFDDPYHGSFEPNESVGETDSEPLFDPPVVEVVNNKKSPRRDSRQTILETGVNQNDAPKTTQVLPLDEGASNDDWLNELE